MARILIKDWHRFQHYSERKPPWIKLHRELLDNYEFHCLPVASKALAPLLWLLASESADGSIDYNLAMIGFRFRMTGIELEKAMQPLVKAGFINIDECASSTLAGCNRIATLETETETETETEAETIPAWVPKEQWQGFVQMRTRIKKPLTRRAVTLAVNRLLELQAQGHSPSAVLDQSTMNSWQGLFPLKEHSNGKSSMSDFQPPKKLNPALYQDQ